MVSQKENRVRCLHTREPVVCGGQTDVTVRICLAVVIVVTNTQYAINDWKLLWLFCGLWHQLILPALTEDFPPLRQQSGEW